LLEAWVELVEASSEFKFVSSSFHIKGIAGSVLFANLTEVSIFAAICFASHSLPQEFWHYNGATYFPVVYGVRRTPAEDAARAGVLVRTSDVAG
jgi:hypothetical protein